MRILTSSPPLVPLGELAPSDSEKADALADSLDAPFQPVNDQSEPAVIEVVNEAMRAYSFAPASQPTLTIPTEDQDNVRGLKVGKAPSPNGTPNRAEKLCHKSVLVVLWSALSFPDKRLYIYIYSYFPKRGNRDLSINIHGQTAAKTF